jgi:hypothetical protein
MNFDALKSSKPSKVENLENFTKNYIVYYYFVAKFVKFDDFLRFLVGSYCFFGQAWNESVGF